VGCLGRAVSDLVTVSTSRGKGKPKKREPANNTRIVEEAEETEVRRLAPEGNEGRDNGTTWAPRAKR